MTGEISAHEFGEAVHEHGEATCEGCGESVDLSDADTVEEGREIWNEHIRTEHPENA